MNSIWRIANFPKVVQKFITFLGVFHDFKMLEKSEKSENRKSLSLSQFHLTYSHFYYLKFL